MVEHARGPRAWRSALWGAILAHLLVGACSDGLQTSHAPGLAAECGDQAWCTFRCPERSIGSSVGAPAYEGEAFRGENQIAGSCGGATTSEATLGWVAPWDGTYRIEASSSGAPLTLHARGGSCRGPELACAHSGLFDRSWIELSLSANDPVVLAVEVVDPSHPLRLDIVHLEQDAAQRLSGEHP